MGCYGLSGAYGAVDKAEYKDVLKRAYELGINFYDTADTYGEDAEKILGEVIGHFREKVHISTKVGIKEGDKPNLSYKCVKKACNGSLRRLNTDYIDFYLIHFDDPETPIEETAAALNDLKTDGKILHYGVSHLPRDRIKECIKIGNVSIILMELSAVARETRKKLLPLCEKNDVGVVAFSVTGRRILTGKYGKKPQFAPSDIRNIDPLFHRARFESALRIVSKLEEIGTHYNKTPVQVAVRWVLFQPAVICALTGPSKLKHLGNYLDI